MAKSVFASKTIWFNTIVGAIGALWPIVSPLLPITGPQGVAIAAVGNIILRLITSQPVAVMG